MTKLVDELGSIYIIIISFLEWEKSLKTNQNSFIVYQYYLNKATLKKEEWFFLSMKDLAPEN